ncbi:MAG: asparagine synthase (glutamine-hydrolyzing) [Phycisphaerales bacterium]|nr:asparagine synthase (glutamine-hydrolyzing) [Phycisphaerales bacterium]
MCGFSCIVRRDGQPIPDELLNRLGAVLAHRGPDGEGVLRDCIDGDGGRVEIALIHRRLSVIDRQGGAQPMTTADGRLTVVFNGCIYNHRALRRELQAAGHAFTSDHSDTEVLLHGHKQWGSGLPEHLEGMFAYILLDREDRTLKLARDRAGEKPIYVRDAGDVMTIASERSAMPAAPDDDDRSASRAVADYLRWGAVTFLPWIDGSTSLAPGTQRVINLDRREESDAQTYWSAPTRRETDEPHSRTIEQHVETLLEQAVAARLEADVPIGCFLSGGIDSSLIAAMALRCKPDLATFCVKMNDARYDESHHAAAVAAHLHAQHTTLDVSMNPAEDLVHLVETMGEPFADSSILPTYWVSKAAREHVTVALSGDGGDELFLGYERHIAMQLLQRWSGILRRLPVSMFAGSHPKSRRRKLARLTTAARGRSWFEQYCSIVNLFDTRQLRALGVDAGDPETPQYDGQAGPEAAILHDFAFNLPLDLLRKVDAASMACGLEVRCPFLDSSLIDCAMSLPLSVLTPRMRRKDLLKRIARRHLPGEIVDRPKMGFTIPIGEWFRSDFGGMKTLLTDQLGSSDPFGSLPVDASAARRMMDEHLSGNADHSHRLFALLSLSIWVT